MNIECNVWAWIISEFEQIVPRCWVGTASKQSNNRNVAPLKGAQHNIYLPPKKTPSLEPGISCSEKRTKAWEKRRSTNLGSKKLPQLHPSTIEKSSVFLRAINFHPLPTLETLDMNVILKIFSASHHPSTACRTRDARWQPTAISTQGFHLRLQSVHQVLQIQVFHSYPGIHQDPGLKYSNGKYSNQHNLMEFSQAWTQTWKYLGEVFRNSHQHEWIPMAYSDNRI